MDIYISIATIKKYEQARQLLIESISPEWRNKYILVFQNENENSFKVFEDGHIEVYIKNNIYEYGNYVGVNLLLKENVIPHNSWFLFIHDTCKFIENNSYELTYKLIEEHDNTDIDILWLCKNGQCNICLIRKKAIEIGDSVYKDILVMDKMDAISYEWNDTDSHLSPKKFNVVQKFLSIYPEHMGKKCIYNNEIIRYVVLFKSINMEKYYVLVSNSLEHPYRP